jgi:hypothetical protein
VKPPHLLLGRERGVGAKFLVGVVVGEPAQGAIVGHGAITG